LHHRRALFRQPAANPIDDASHRCAGVKPNARIDPAWKKQVASPVCLSQESRGFGLRDNKRCNPGSDGANEGQWQDLIYPPQVDLVQDPISEPDRRSHPGSDSKCSQFGLSTARISDQFTVPARHPSMLAGNRSVVRPASVPICAASPRIARRVSDSRQLRWFQGISIKKDLATGEPPPAAGAPTRSGLPGPGRPLYS
jgi:hypothetical protein